MEYKLPPVIRGPVYDNYPLAETIDWGLVAMGAESAWYKSKGKGEIICVLDTGVPEHKDLPTPKATKNFVGGSIKDVNGHATHCAGIIGARANGQGVVGYAPECEMMYGKVLNDSGSGSSNAIAAGIRWAVDTGATIISISIGGGYDQVVEAACDYAWQNKVLIVAAAGNSGAGAGVDYPGRYVTTLAVASFRQDGNISVFSSGGPEVDFAMPGEKILSTLPGNKYGEMSGTSMATPAAAGMIADMYASRPTHEYIRGVYPTRKIIAESAKDRGTPGKDNRFGVGIPDMNALVVDTTYWFF